MSVDWIGRMGNYTLSIRQEHISGETNETVCDSIVARFNWSEEWYTFHGLHATSGVERPAIELPSTRKLTLILTERNLGFAEGNNVGTRYRMNYLCPAYMLLPNNDTVVRPDFLSIGWNCSIWREGWCCTSCNLFVWRSGLPWIVGRKNQHVDW